MNRQIPQDRVKNFFEVALGLSKEEALSEAGRCLDCKDPACVRGCPVQIDIPAFISLIKEGALDAALTKIKEKNALPAICGRVCPQEDQCEAVCVLMKKKAPINIGALERFASDYGLAQLTQTRPTPRRGNLNEQRNKVAVIGSGPAGLTAAAELAKIGYSVTLFESLHLAGGVLVYGIPEFRLPKEIVRREVDYIKGLGVEIKTDVLIGRTLTIKDLFKLAFVSVFIGTGAGLPRFLGIPGENLPGVYSANEFLTRVNLMKAYKFPEYDTPVTIGRHTAVIGGGNVAFDCARCAIRLGSQVTLVYRRTEKQMPAREEEIQNAKEEGLNFSLLTQPTKILSAGIDFPDTIEGKVLSTEIGPPNAFKGGVLSDSQNKITALECIKMRLGDLDASGRQRPVPIPNSTFALKTDTVIVAVGQNPNPLLLESTPELKTNKDGTLTVDEHFQTSMSGVFAGGDIITGADTVISAMGAGKKAAGEIDRYIRTKKQNNHGR